MGLSDLPQSFYKHERPLLVEGQDVETGQAVFGILERLAGVFAGACDLWLNRNPIAPRSGCDDKISRATSMRNRGKESIREAAELQI